MKKSISIVIPNYNGKSLLKTNIPFLYNALKTSEISDYEIIIPDDASADDSVNFIKRNYPNIILIENKVNKGFSVNINKGIFKSTKELVFILNSDVILTDNYFRNLISYFDKPDTFGVMGRIIDPKTEKIQDGAKFPQYKFGAIVGTKNYTSKKETPLYTFFMSGANALINREKLFELNGFDEIFTPYYGEDIDLSLRAWGIGYKCYYEHNAICKHSSSETIKKEPGNKVKIITKRNKLFLHFIHLNSLELSYFSIIIILKTFFRMLIFDTIYLKSFILFIKSYNKCLSSKRKFKTLQKQKGTNLSVKDTVNYILRNIETLEIEKF